MTFRALIVHPQVIDASEGCMPALHRFGGLCLISWATSLLFFTAFIQLLSIPFGVSSVLGLLARGESLWSLQLFLLFVTSVCGPLMLRRALQLWRVAEAVRRGVIPVVSNARERAMFEACRHLRDIRAYNALCKRFCLHHQAHASAGGGMVMLVGEVALLDRFRLLRDLLMNASERFSARLHKPEGGRWDDLSWCASFSAQSDFDHHAARTRSRELEQQLDALVCERYQQQAAS